jgi:hypothetical protein
LDGGNEATAWDSTHPGSRDRIAKLEEKYNLYLTKKQSLRGTPSQPGMIGSEFIPEGLLPYVTKPQSSNSAVSSQGGMIWNLWSGMSQQLQVASVFEALKVAAVTIDHLMDLFEASPSSSSSSPYDDIWVCEDGESKISFQRVKPGYFIHLGHGYCLSARDLSDMASSSVGVSVNPYTQQPFTRSQKQDIARLLRGERLS